MSSFTSPVDIVKTAILTQLHTTLGSLINNVKWTIHEFLVPNRKQFELELMFVEEPIEIIKFCDTHQYAYTHHFLPDSNFYMMHIQIPYSYSTESAVKKALMTNALINTSPHLHPVKVFMYNTGDCL